MTVLVLGATGHVGPYVVSSLSAEGHPVRVITRRPDRAAEILGLKAELVVGDSSDWSVLESALKDVESVFLLSPHSFDLAEVQLRVIRALRRTGIKIVKLSATSTGVDPDGPLTLRQHWEIEQVLRGSGQPYVMLQPNGFMQTLIGDQLAPVVRRGGAIPNAIGDAVISVVDAEDVGAVAARVLTSSDWDGQTLALTGPRALSYPAIAEIIGATIGRAVSVVDTTPAQVADALRARGLEPWEIGHFQEMFQLFRDGRSQLVTDDIYRVTGRPAGSVDEYVQREIALFASDNEEMKV